MTDRVSKRRRRFTRLNGRQLPWSDPTLGDVHGWLREAFDNLADADFSGERRFQRAQDAASFTGILAASWADREFPAYPSDEEVLSLFSRTKQLFETLLKTDHLTASWSAQAYDVKAAKQLGSALAIIMHHNIVSIRCVPQMIRDARQAAVMAAQFALSAGHAATLEGGSDCGRGTGAAADAAELACMLYRAADISEKYHARLH